LAEWRSGMNNVYGTEPYQEQLLQLMKDIDCFCQNNHIKYSLAGGTLLGAVRHNGFIPWDDDADIMLDRVNFEKLILVIETTDNDFKLIRDKWVIRIEYSDNRLFVGRWHPSVDLFVIDNVPTSKIKNTIKVLGIKTLQGMMKNKVRISDYKGIYRMCIMATNLMGKAFPSDMKYRWYNLISQIGNKEPAVFVASFNDLFHLISIKYDGMLMKAFECHRFEDTEFPITKKYDNYLTVQYGDYMTLPPEDKRNPGHLETINN
jgi:lipopolysaccharide cholinephosphotransferase